MEGINRMNNDENKIYLVTGFNKSYLPKAMSYLETISINSNIHNIAITLDFSMSDEDKKRLSSIEFIEMSSDTIKSPNPNNCMQHGAFLSALDFVDEDSVIIFTDSDIKMQRMFTDEELLMFSQYVDNEIGVNYNKSAEQSLADEANGLHPNIPIGEIVARFPRIIDFKTFNTGVIIANFKTYMSLYNLYNQCWSESKDIFDHHAKQQWLLSYLIQKKFNVKVLPYSIHFHGTQPIELRTQGRHASNLFCIDQKPVIFNHTIVDQQEKLLLKQIKENKKTIRKLKRIVIFLGVICIILLALILIYNT